MRRLSIILSLALLLALALVTGAGAQSQPFRVDIYPLDNSGVLLGTATLTATGNQTRVVITLSGEPTGASYPAHIHAGTCANLGAVEFPLTDVVNGTSTTTVNATLTNLTSGFQSMSLARSRQEPNAYFACGTIVGMGMSGGAGDGVGTATTTETLPTALPHTGAGAAAHADGCQFILGFATLHDLIPQQVGQCLENEQHNPANGDGLQHTTGVAGAGGLLVWRKADNWTAFTDGYRTWVNGPTGLEQRLNTQRFAWEANPDGLPVMADAPADAAPVASADRVVADPQLGLALTVPSDWQLSSPGQEAPGVLAFSSAANHDTRLYVSSRGTTTDPDDAHAASVGMDTLLQGITMQDAPRVAVSYGGAPGVLVGGLPGGPVGAIAIILAHQGALYKILVPGAAIAADQQQALDSLRFIPRVGPFPPAN